ncbi:hypothetical protein SAMN05421780_10690 [Flexibacter flexilis DSM 6793]|uniref:DUF6089 domain-containing protein n=1 Tax=Flexibacter flexilis DSM 6793 TaxID=927664 RepID=A0A1I1JTV5_9BACT|nr:DUF6089 family protein [Flexibacter flexilis]SFC51671.1 hypothetical protein SAMN05421780_10690 [Flexibacter flexilis DSM 6793]
MKKVLSLLLLVVTLSVSNDVLAQSPIGKRAKRAADRSKSRPITHYTLKKKFPKHMKYISVGGGIGAANYFGDLAPRLNRFSSDIKMTRTFVSGVITRRYSPYLSFRASLAWARLRGDDYSAKPSRSEEERGRYIRGLSFRNDVKEFSITAIGDLLPTEKGYMRRNFLNGYGFIGLSVFTNNPKAKAPDVCPGCEGSAGKWVALQPLQTEGKKYSTIQLGIPMGIGARYRLGDKLDLSFEVGYRWTFTDYLDDVSTEYVENTSTLKNDLARVMANRSAEATAASAGKNRNIDQISPYPIVTDPNSGLPYVQGNEHGSSPRGNSGGKDYYIVTAFHLTYILDARSRAPKFR